ncbi:hypothetical protein FGO68_gene568 [Halteria grandinella]|uniref:CBS domain-containing protein n=1 Tax=Halteria grandinella TaxID=5974 RepID=A0A8J8NCF2_HALGN|nr:hypothetical protein FGO68_gene568 [Halteria grandinella]
MTIPIVRTTFEKQLHSTRTTISLKDQLSQDLPGLETTLKDSSQPDETILSQSFDLQNPNFSQDTSPLIVREDTPLSKIHFIFTMLNETLIFVVDEQQRLKGLISKMQFIKRRKSPLEKVEENTNQYSYCVTVKENGGKGRLLLKDGILCKLKNFKDPVNGEMAVLLVKPVQ